MLRCPHHSCPSVFESNSAGEVRFSTMLGTITGRGFAPGVVITRVFAEGVRSMLRTIMASMALAALCLGGANAGGKKEGEKERERPKGKRVVATFIRADTEAEPDTI